MLSPFYPGVDILSYACLDECIFKTLYTIFIYLTILVPRKAVERKPEETTRETVEIVVTDTQPVSQKPTSEIITPLGRHFFYYTFLSVFCP